MKIIFYGLSLLIFFVSCVNEKERILPTLNSTDIGNGGDLIQCYPDKWMFPYDFEQGWYVLDYAEFLDDIDYTSLTTTEEYLKKVMKIIASADQRASLSLKNFLSSIPFLSLSFDKFESEITRLWMPVLDLNEVEDEGRIYLSPTCLHEEQKGPKVRLHQVVLRRAKYDSSDTLLSVLYEFDSQLVQKLYKKDLQLSMLLIHEWLWDYYQPNEGFELRQSNRELHSTSQLSSKYIREKILRIN